ncbi:MAG: 2-C-methyl-D-erythritol 2,4-cyclodiphosphate synthase [Clostridia bacterium]|nr:2-C-methyl-D-erythritol 2,4-cyclodiphosphate synthase [Clostridia bacterium]
MRIGIGYDMHRLVPDRRLIIGGVDIPYEKGLLGHSDADVLAHAIIDALFGAAALGDIGRHFPDTDPKYKGADSMVLLGEACRLIDEAGYSIINIDTNIIIQSPKMAPHIEAIRARLAEVMGVDVGAVSVKAKTNEKLDSVGQGEGVIAQAVCLLTEK